MKKMSTKQKKRNNIISSKRFEKAKKRKPHLEMIARAMLKIKISHRRIERANRRMIRLSKQAQAVNQRAL